MRLKPFLDTNVLVYAFTDQDPRKERASALVAAADRIAPFYCASFSCRSGASSTRRFPSRPTCTGRR